MKRMSLLYLGIILVISWAIVSIFNYSCMADYQGIFNPKIANTASYYIPGGLNSFDMGYSFRNIGGFDYNLGGGVNNLNFNFLNQKTQTGIGQNNWLNGTSNFMPLPSASSQNYLPNQWEINGIYSNMSNFQPSSRYNTFSNSFNLLPSMGLGFSNTFNPLPLNGFSMWNMFPAYFGSGGRSGSSSPSPTSHKTGILSLNLTDASTQEYEAIYVTIDEVCVHIEGEETRWEIVASPNKTFNLLELVNGVMDHLGTKELKTGLYTQMRLIIGDTPETKKNILGNYHPYANYIIDHYNNIHKLKIPSGFQTGIKLVRTFEIIEGLTTELILDFDASRSIVKAGRSGKYLLKPTIKVVGTIENAILEGIVTNEESYILEGVLVSAQVYNGDAVDEKDKVHIQTSTITDENGNYKMFLEPGGYNIVAYKEGYTPDCIRIETLNNTTYIQDFTLALWTSGTISGEIIGDFGLSESEEQIVMISFRQASSCGNTIEEQIEVKLLNIGIDVQGICEYTVDLPTGTYNVIASTDNRETLLFDDITITEVTETTLDIDFNGNNP